MTSSREALALASQRGYPDIMLLQRHVGALTRSRFRKTPPGFRCVLISLLNLADALEITQVVQTTDGHGGVKGPNCCGNQFLSKGPTGRAESARNWP